MTKEELETAASKLKVKENQLEKLKEEVFEDQMFLNRLQSQYIKERTQLSYGDVVSLGGKTYKVIAVYLNKSNEICLLVEDELRRKRYCSLNDLDKNEKD